MLLCNEIFFLFLFSLGNPAEGLLKPWTMNGLAWTQEAPDTEDGRILFYQISPTDCKRDKVGFLSCGCKNNTQR